ncbi:MAG: Flp pilus assembly complex ATPase component TadA [Desulfomicrobium escambiense]|nr:Flp pilus assembly complex ATPase component TadA [Desulfomicrobium escambiense]
MGPLPLKVRYRKDGVCFQVHQIGAVYKAAVLSRIKIMAKLDIAERRRPQDGKITDQVRRRSGSNTGSR